MTAGSLLIRRYTSEELRSFRSMNSNCHVLPGGVVSGVCLLGLNQTTSHRGRHTGREKQHCGDRLHVHDADWLSDRLLPTGSRAAYRPSQNVNTTSSADQTCSTATIDSRLDSSLHAINVIIGRRHFQATENNSSAVKNSSRSVSYLRRIPIVDSRLPSVLLTNVCHLGNKLDDLSVTAQQYKPNVICITETWLNENIPEANVNLIGLGTTFLGKTE